MCDCAGQINDGLKEHGLRLIQSLYGPTRGRVWVATYIFEKKRGRVDSPIMANFCPFCGKPYEEAAAAGEGGEPASANDLLTEH